MLMKQDRKKLPKTLMGPTQVADAGGGREIEQTGSSTKIDRLVYVSDISWGGLQNKLVTI